MGKHTKRKKSSTSSNWSSDENSLLECLNPNKPVGKKQKSLERHSVEIPSKMATSVSNEELMAQLKTIQSTIEVKIENVKLDVMKIISEKVNQLEKDLYEIREENKKLKAIVETQVKTQILAAERIASAACSKVNNLEQWTRRSSVRIFGIPDKMNENYSESIQEALKVFLSIGVSMTEDQIDIAHRIGTFKPNQNRSIIVKFLSRKYKIFVIKNRRKLKGSGISISEDLTPLNSQLLSRTSKHPSVLNTWSTEGKIYAKLLNEKIVKVDHHTCIDDLLRSDITNVKTADVSQPEIQSNSRAETRGTMEHGSTTTTRTPRSQDITYYLTPSSSKSSTPMMPPE
ncbi:hypothetical protein SNE40_018265 [Patella caerulea]|uniref:Uncharacterized protein n=1 Tax=Patella caerulea TaxID=87958 RepID=A0AAN8PK35_PATCE